MMIAVFARSLNLPPFIMTGTKTYADVISNVSGGNPVTVLVASNITPVSRKKGTNDSNFNSPRHNNCEFS